MALRLLELNRWPLRLEGLLIIRLLLIGLLVLFVLFHFDANNTILIAIIKVHGPLVLVFFL